MKRLIFSLAMVLLFLPLYAQGESIRFALMDVTGEDLPVEAMRAFNMKLRQAFNRSQALTEAKDALFTVRPTLTLEDTDAKNPNLLNGSLNLELINTLDGIVLYGSVIPVNATVTGSKEEALKKMATNIESTDPIFIRFVKTARKNIIDHYDKNCATIIRRAQTLAELGKKNDAVKLLTAIPRR